MRYGELVLRRRLSFWLLALFSLSAAWGVWAAFDQAVAWSKFWLILCGLMIYVVCLLAPEHIRVGTARVSPLQVVLGVLPTVAAVFLLLTNDWARWEGKLSWLAPVMRWFSSWQVGLGGRSLNPNVAGGLIAVFLPLQVAALWGGEHRRVELAVLLSSLSIVGLVMSAARGAWIALTLVFGGWLVWRLSGQLAMRWMPRDMREARSFFSVAVILASAIVVTLFLRLTPLGSRVLMWIENDRAIIWRNSFDLASDYVFSGLGLGNFEMPYVSYVLLTHVGHTFHAHNLFLDIWLEQGILGLAVFGGWIITAARTDRSSPWRSAGLAALAVVVLHGLVDDAFYGYGGRGVLLLFVPLAILNRSPDISALVERPEPRPIRRLMPLVALGIVILAMWLLPLSRAMWQANWGVLLQTRAEMSVYRWPDWPIQDELRRSLQINLQPALTHYQTALALDPRNATANRRLGQIELSRGQYELARQHLEMAYAAAPGQRATRQLLGECYAVAGEIEGAVALWRTVDVSQGQLRIRQWWHEHLGEQKHAMWVAQAAAAVSK